MEPGYLDKTGRMMKMQGQNYRKGWFQRGALSQEAGYVEASGEAEVKERPGKGWEGLMEAVSRMPVIWLRGWSEVLQFK